MSTYPETQKEIQTGLDNEVLSRFPSIGNTPVAEWKFWTLIMSVAIRTIQVIIKAFRDEVEDKLNYIRPGTIGWYALIARQFQYGYNLIVKADGSLGYENDVEAAKIISAVAVTENDGIVTLKVARLVNSVLAPLDQNQLLAFSNYISSVKFVGTKTTIVSTVPDVIGYAIKVYYDPSKDPEAITDLVQAAIDQYKNELGFDGIVYRQKFINKIMSVDGIVTCDMTAFAAIPAGGDPVSIGIMYETQAGYFNYNENSGFTIFPASQINQTQAQ